MHCKKSVQLSKKELETACEQVLFTDNVFYLKIFSNEGQKIEEKKSIRNGWIMIK